MKKLWIEIRSGVLALLIVSAVYLAMTLDFKKPADVLEGAVPVASGMCPMNSDDTLAETQADGVYFRQCLILFNEKKPAKLYFIIADKKTEKVIELDVETRKQVVLWKRGLF